MEYFSLCTVRTSFPDTVASHLCIEHEAMSINSTNKVVLPIKILIGVVNVVSGEPAIEDLVTTLRRVELIGQNKSVQDCVVTQH